MARPSPASSEQVGSRQDLSPPTLSRSSAGLHSTTSLDVEPPPMWQGCQDEREGGYPTGGGQGSWDCPVLGPSLSGGWGVSAANTIPLGVRTSGYTFGGDTIQSMAGTGVSEGGREEVRGGWRGERESRRRCWKGSRGGSSSGWGTKSPPCDGEEAHSCCDDDLQRARKH